MGIKATLTLAVWLKNMISVWYRTKKNVGSFEPKIKLKKKNKPKTAAYFYTFRAPTHSTARTSILGW